MAHYSQVCLQQKLLKEFNPKPSAKPWIELFKNDVDTKNDIGHCRHCCYDRYTPFQLNQMAEADNALVEAERVFKLNMHLHDEKANGSQELKHSESNYKY